MHPIGEAIIERKRNPIKKRRDNWIKSGPAHPSMTEGKLLIDTLQKLTVQINCLNISSPSACDSAGYVVA